MNDSKKIPESIETAFENIMQHILGDKYIDIFALSGDNSSDDCDSIDQQVAGIKVMTFYLLAEHKQSEKLSELIGSAINSYINSPDITISSDELNKNIDINLDRVYSDFNKIYKILCNKINYSDKFELTESIKGKLDIANKKDNIVFILNMLDQIIDDKNKELFLAYIPSIIYAFHENYIKGINSCIKKLRNRKANENEISKIKSLLTMTPKKISAYSTCERERNHQNSINSFLFVSLYNAIVTNYNKNFIIDFLWFERNIGFYQYYLTEEEYSKVINFIAGVKSTNTIHKIDISIPTALYLIFKDKAFDEDLWKTFDLVLDANNVLDNEEIYNFMNGIFTNASNDFDIDHNSAIGYFSKDSFSEPCSLKHRFAIYSVQALYYRDLLCKENFIKNNMCFYDFHCDEISDDDFKLEDVTFNPWYTSDFTVEKDFSTIYADKKYYIVSPALIKNNHIKSELFLNNSIISTRKIKKIWLKDNPIDNKAAILKFENVKFKNLSVEYKPIDYNAVSNCFTSKSIVEKFSKINKTDTNKIYVFLGLHYFTNIEDYPQGRRNIIALYVNGLMGYQNFFPIRSTFDYSEMPIIISRYLRTLRIYGSSADFYCSTSCGGSCNANASSEAEQKRKE